MVIYRPWIIILGPILVYRYRLTVIRYYFVEKITQWTALIAKFMGQHGAHLGPTGPRWAPCWHHELCYLGAVPWITTTKSTTIKRVHVSWDVRRNNLSVRILVERVFYRRFPKLPELSIMQVNLEDNIFELRTIFWVTGEFHKGTHTKLVLDDNRVGVLYSLIKFWTSKLRCTTRMKDKFNRRQFYSIYKLPDLIRRESALSPFSI